MILEANGKKPQVAADAFVAETATVVGDVILESGASVWYNAIVDGTPGPVRVGARSNVQDGCILSATPDHPVTVGAEVSLGHGAILHGCTVSRGALIAMRAIVDAGATVGEEAWVGAAAVVPAGMAVAPRTLVLGNPASYKRDLTEEELASNRERAQRYVQLALDYRQAL